MLLNTYNHHYTAVHFVFGIFCLCLGLGQFLCGLFFILSLIAINFIASLQQTLLFFVHFLESLLLFLDENVDEESEKFLISERSV